MTFIRVLIHEAFLPAAALLVAMTAVEFVEPGFASGVVNLPVATITVILLGVLRIMLDRKEKLS